MTEVILCKYGEVVLKGLNKSWFEGLMLRELRRRLRAMAKGMGAADPGTLGDGLLLLIEGAYISSQIFGPGGPSQSVAKQADLLIGASLKS